MRKFFGARYKSDFERANLEFSKLSAQEKIERFNSSEIGREISEYIMRDQGKNISFAENLDEKISEFFPNAEIESTHYDHEYCHAVSSYFSSPFDRGLLITMDGSGDNTFSHAYIANSEGIRHIASSPSTPISEEIGHIMRLQENRFWSIGAIYTWFTTCLGYNFGDEGKIEALAAYGKPIPELLSILLRYTNLDESKHSINLDYKNLSEEININVMEEMTRLHGPENMSATVQAYLEDIVYRYVSHLIDFTGETQLMLSGGVFANVILNMKIFENLTSSIFIVPAMADDGSAQGAAMLAMLNNGCKNSDLDWIKNHQMPYFGTSYSRDQVQDALAAFRDQIDVVDLGNDWPERVAELVLRERVGGIFHGKMEWGPRALGNRSIIADARDPEIKALLNNSIKKRTSFQPFCPSILLEEKDRLFANAYENLHMTCAFRMKEEFRNSLPGAVHIDGTARVQFVTEQENQNYYRILRKVKEISGFGVLINTSFNKHGRTIVESPANAVTDFLDTKMPFLCIEGYLVTHKRN